MSPSMLHQLWSLIENTQASIILSLDDTTLVQWLDREFRLSRSLDNTERDVLKNYIQSRISLIRDLAAQR